MKKLLFTMLFSLTLMAENVPFKGFIEGFSTGSYLELTKNNKVKYHECGGTMGCYTLPEWEVDYKKITCIQDNCYKITKTKITLLTLDNKTIKKCDNEGYLYGDNFDCTKEIILLPKPRSIK